MTNKDKKYSIEELSALTGHSKRTIRFYIQKEMMDPPEGQRKGAYYLERHLVQLLEIKKWQDAGVSLEKIKAIMAQPTSIVPPCSDEPGSVEVWSHVVIDEGVKLLLNPQKNGLSPEQVKTLGQQIVAIYQNIKSQN